MCFPKYKLLIVSRAPCARSLAAARAEKKPRETIIIAMRARPPLLPRHSRESAGLFPRFGFMKYPRHSFAPDSFLRPCRAPFMIRAVQPRRFNCACMYVRRVHVPLQRRYYTLLLSVASIFFFVGNAWFSNFA